MHEEQSAGQRVPFSQPQETVPVVRLTRKEWGLLLTLAAVQFTYIIDFVIMMPLGPAFGLALGTTPKQFGLMVSAYGFSAALSGFFAAWFIDRFDRKRALLWLYAGFIGGTFLCAIAPGYWMLVLARAVAGGFAGVVASLVLAIVGDVFADARRGTAMGVVMSAFSVASIFGVPAALVLAQWYGWRTPFYVLAVVSVAVLLMAWRLLPSLRGHLTRIYGPPTDTWQVVTHPLHVRAYILTTVLVVSSWTIHPYLSIYLVNNVHMKENDLPLIWFFGGIAALLTTTPTGWLSDRYGKLRMYRIVGTLTVVPTLIMTNLPPVHLSVILLVMAVFMVLASGRMVPAMALITATAEPHYRGSFLSVNAAVQQLALGIAPLFAGLILGDTEGTEPLTGFTWVGLIAVAAMLLSVPLAGRLRPAAGGLEAADSLDEEEKADDEAVEAPISSMG